MALQVLASDKALAMNGFGLIGMVQNHEINTNMNAQDVFELGRDSKSDTSYEEEAAGSFEVLSTGNLPGLLARFIAQRDETTNEFLGFHYSGTNKNAYTFTQADLTEATFDLVEYEKPNQKTWTRSKWVPRCFPTQISGRFDAAGLASETIQWQGLGVVGFDGVYHDLIATPLLVTDSTNLELPAGVSTTGYTLAYVYVDERRFRLTGAAGVSDETTFSSALAMTTSEGFAIPANAICRAVFYKTATPSTTFPLLASGDRGTPAFYVRGAQVDLFIAPADIDAPLASEKWLKVQSLDYTIDLRSEQLRQIAFAESGSSVYCVAPQLPFDVSVSATVYESDWSDWRAILKKTGVGVYNESYDFAPDSLKGDPDNPLGVVIRTFTKSKALLATTKFSDLRLDAPSERVAVQGRSEMTWSFKGTAFTFQGFNV